MNQIILPDNGDDNGWWWRNQIYDDVLMDCEEGEQDRELDLSEYPCDADQIRPDDRCQNEGGDVVFGMDNPSGQC